VSAFVSSGCLVKPGVATDTTADGGWEPVTVTARLSEPVIGLGAHPAHLDGPAAFSAFLSWTDALGRHSLTDPDDPERCEDFALPFATWTAPAPGAVHPLALAAGDALVWGWACSRAVFEAAAHSTVQVRKHPETGVAARYARDARWDIGGGPLKARDVPFGADLVREVRWHALADPGPLLALLRRVRHLGRLGGHGNGRVLRWDIEEHRDRDAWRDRVLPLAGGVPGSVRAPYWHPSRRMPCTR
jgi:hypothetical protein